MNGDAFGLIGPIVVTVLFAAAGVVCTFWPQAVQRYALSGRYAQSNPVMKWRGLRRYTESRFYIWQLRALGILSLFAAAFSAYLLLSG
jgi:hypothetical protein